MTAPAPPVPALEDYAFQLTIPTRWHDNDVYGHVNNVVYYSYFDTAVNAFLIREGGLDIHRGQVIGLVVESSCRYMKPLSFPFSVTAGVRIAKLGSSSVRYEIGLFAEGDPESAATGFFVHVFVDRDTRRSTPILPEMRAALAALMPSSPAGQ